MPLLQTMITINGNYLDSVALRGEKLELLVNKAENLSSNSTNFRVQSRTLQRSLFWKNVKIYVWIVLIGIVSEFLVYTH